MCWFFRAQLPARRRRRVYAWTGGGLLLFLLLLLRAEPLLHAWEAAAYPHRVIYEEDSPYQHIVLTENRNDLRLYLDRVIQFSSRDEYRYHEPLARLPAAQVPGFTRALILGGGEGLLARELLRYPSLRSLTIVDLDERVVDLGRRHPRIRRLNGGALDDPRTRTVTEDAAVFLRNDTSHYDLILADLPDPATESVARLYSTWFFGLARARLRPDGVFATQATSPYHTRRSYWCIVHTLAAAGFGELAPYHAPVPSFGEWGFVLAANGGNALRAGGRWLGADAGATKFLRAGLLPTLFTFPEDMSDPGDVSVNRLDRPVLLQYFLDEWSDWQRETVQ